jgi:hypothetical protein
MATLVATLVADLVMKRHPIGSRRSNSPPIMKYLNASRTLDREIGFVFLKIQEYTEKTLVEKDRKI